MSRITYFADIIVPLSIPNKYTYRVPAEWNDLVEQGMRVLVQFGKSKIYTGIIYKIHQEAPQGYQAKYIESILDEKPVVEEWQLKFWDWLSFYYMSNPGDVMNAALPSGLKLSSESHIQLNATFPFEETEHAFFTDKEHKVIELLHTHPNISIHELGEMLKVKSPQSLIQKLLKKDAVEVYEEVKDKFKPKRVCFIRLNDSYHSDEAFGELMKTLEKKAFKQAEVLLYFIQLTNTVNARSNWIRKSELAQRTDSAAINALIKKGVFEQQETEVDRISFLKGKSVQKVLNAEQESVLSKTISLFSSGKPVLLKGVTGSGKTEIYIRLITKELEAGKQVLYLVPEIALTTQLIKRLRDVFNEKVGVYHSRFSESERVEIWNNILNHPKDTENSKNYRVIIAARSGLFLPFSNLGLIIVDEEHDYSYKQQSPAPRYNARDAAIYLSKMHQSKILLGSATPGLETYYNAVTGKYELIELNKTFSETGSVDIEICDIKKFESQQSMKGILTPPLYHAIQNALDAGQQIILFQNRRGFAPYTQCNSCGTVPYCINCDVPLIYHKYIDKLSCHYCGYQTSVPKICNACGKPDLRFRGLGTEKIEEDIELLFPDAKIARMDLDSTRSKHAHRQLIDDFESGQIDVLIGTQMVTKGLDFDNVSVVGVLNIDSVLNFPDFRSHERAYQLLMQLRGRAGRKNHKGKLFIQTAQPEHIILNTLIQKNIDEFYKLQLTEREAFRYPPFVRLIEVNVISSAADELNALSAELASELKGKGIPEILGPEYPPVPRIRGKYYKRILIKYGKKQSMAEIRGQVNESITNLYSSNKKLKFSVQVNVDP